MFPLGSVLLPGGVLPLHIFEDRYQQLLNHALEADRRFGVVLISRGSEVGGGEIRTETGTVAHIDEHQRFDDGRAAVMCTGTTRLEVVEWLDDEPYPRALIRELAIDAEGRNDRDLFRSARQSFQDLIELGQRLGRLDSVPDVDWDDDIEKATWQLAARSPCTPLDQQAILSARSRADRLGRIEERLKEVYADLELMGGLDSSS
jgi:Lon protease-like protein